MDLVLWSAAYLLWLHASDPESALLWLRICTFFVVLIPYFFLNFCFQYVDKNGFKKQKITNALCALVFSTSMLTPWVIQGVQPFLEFHYAPKVGSFFYLVVLYFAYNVSWGHFLIIKNGKISKGLPYIFVGTLIGFIGGTSNFFPYLGIPFPPYGNFLISVYSPLVAYGIIRYRVIDASLALSLIFIRLIIFVTLGAVYLGLAFALKEIIQDGLYLVILSCLFLIATHEIYPWMKKKIEASMTHSFFSKVSYKHGDISKKLLRITQTHNHLDDLLSDLKSVLSNDMGLPNVLICIRKDVVSGDGSEVSCFMRWDKQDVVSIELDSPIPLPLLSAGVLLYEETTLDFRDLLDEQNIKASIPLISAGQCYGLLRLNYRSGEPFFSYYDAQIFEALSSQVGMALDKIGAYSRISFEHTLANQEKQKLLSALAGSIAHEMRSPLGQIKYNLNSIARTLPTPATNRPLHTLSMEIVDKLYQHVTVGELAIERGLQAISMILDEVKSNSIDTSNFVYLQAGKTTQKAVDEYSYETEEERDKIRIRIVRDFTFKGEETLYLFLLFNLIKNALYYFKQSPNAMITITVDRSLVIVKDTGPGIAANRLPQLFEPFQTVGKSGGTGLGLAYCKRVMLALGGDIACESIVGEYTQFTLSFPEVSQAEIDLQRKNIMQWAHSLFKGKRILVVDDDRSLRATTIHMLSNLDAHIDEAEDGRFALEKFKYADYDLIVLDLNMPRLDGYGFAEKIRGGVVASCQSIPIVAYSSEPASVAQAKTKKVGMNGFVSKPCSQLDLIEALGRALEDTEQNTSRENTAILEGKTVLLAEDNVYNRNIVRNYLEEWGISVLEAEHGQAALDQLKAHQKVDVVLMDINMPEIDGLEAVQMIRALPSPYQHVPIIALTGYSDEANIQAAYNAGMNDFITKPLDVIILRKKINHYISVESANKNNEHSAYPLYTQTPKEITEMVKEEQDSIDNLPLLDIEELDEQRIAGFLHVPTNFLEHTQELLEKIRIGCAANNLQAVKGEMHSLAGFHGYLGTLAVHEFIKRLYRFILKNQWPEEEDWVTKLEELNVQTWNALQAYYLEHE